MLLVVTGLLGTGCETVDPPAASNNSTAQRGPNDQPIIDDRIEVGERLKVELRDTGTTEGSASEQVVREDGTISLLYNQSVTAAGKKKGELEEEIHKLYVPKYFRRMTVIIRRESLVFFVRGEVKAPGRQLYDGSMTALRAISSAGDFTEFANKRNVDIIRRTGKKEKFNAAKALQNPERDVPIYPGDIVHVNRSIL